MPYARRIESFHPAYFALVMSTGIVSIAFDGLGFSTISKVLFAVNIPAYLIISAISLVRLAVFPGSVLQDLRDPGRCWGFFTFVVATNTVGSQWMLFLDSIVVPGALWILGLASWVVLTYAIFGYLISRHSGTVETVVSGATLLAVVGTESVAVLGSQVQAAFTPFESVVKLISLTHFAAGWVLYLIIIALVAYRLLVRRLEPANWTGPYWICMGAVAITSLAGANMLIYLDMGNLSRPTLTFTYVAWAIGAWWIPIQLYLDVWKFYRIEISGGRPVWITLFPWLRLGFGDDRSHFYEVLSWGRVFPMGMFTAATIALTRASDFDILFAIPSVWGWFALVVWTLTMLGTLRAISRMVHNVGGGSEGTS